MSQASPLLKTSNIDALAVSPRPAYGDKFAIQTWANIIGSHLEADENAAQQVERLTPRHPSKLSFVALPTSPRRWPKKEAPPLRGGANSTTERRDYRPQRAVKRPLKS
jgi:hypothetical protein